MTGVPPLRLVPAFFVALGLTLAIFLFMQGLIQRSEEGSITLPVYQRVEILRQLPDPETPEEQTQQDEAPAAQPLMEALEVAPPAPQPTADLATGWPGGAAPSAGSRRCGSSRRWSRTSRGRRWGRAGGRGRRCHRDCRDRPV